MEGEELSVSSGLHPIQPSFRLRRGRCGSEKIGRRGPDFGRWKSKEKREKGGWEDEGEEEDREEGGPTTEWGSSGHRRRRRRPSPHGVPTG